MSAVKGPYLMWLARTRPHDQGIMRALLPTYSGRLQAAGLSSPIPPATFSTPSQLHFASRMVSRDLADALPSTPALQRWIGRSRWAERQIAMLGLGRPAGELARDRALELPAAT